MTAQTQSLLPAVATLVNEVSATGPLAVKRLGFWVEQWCRAPTRQRAVQEITAVGLRLRRYGHDAQAQSLLSVAWLLAVRRDRAAFLEAVAKIRLVPRQAEPGLQRPATAGAGLRRK